MGQERLRRVAEQIKKEIGKIIQDELNDPRIGFVTLTRVEVSRDLRLAKVYFSLLGDQKQVRDTQVGLKRSAGFIRKLLAERLKIRYIPEVTFRLDQNIEYSIHIAEVLEKIKGKGESNERKPNN